MHWKVFVDKKSFAKCITYEHVDIKKVISTIEEGGLRIALITNNNNKLVGIVCDGDIRRGLLKGLTLTSPVSQIIEKNYIRVSPNASKKDISRIMKENAFNF